MGSFDRTGLLYVFVFLTFATTLDCQQPGLFSPESETNTCGTEEDHWVIVSRISGITELP